MLSFTTTSSEIFAYFIHYLKTKNIDVDTYLAQHFLPKKSVIQCKNIAISTPLIYEMFTDICCKENLNGFGWYAGLNAGINGLANLSLLAVEESTLENILNSFIKHSQLGSSNANFFIVEHQQTIQFCHKGGLNTPNQGYFEVELYLLSFFQELVKKVTGENFKIDYATVRSNATVNIPINKVDDNQAYFSFLIPKSLLKCPNQLLKTACTFKEFGNIGTSAFLRKNVDDPVSRLKSILMVYDINELPTAKAVALMAQCSLRTLQRNLWQLNSSYVDIIQELKMKQASRLLKDSAMSIEDIARSIHYKNTGHFSRAFKKSYGQTPSSYRKVE
ncbi:helix-turn-helix domain-containing protein [Thalassomonas sp. M1454]|uniref:helix-turn-helix domain-containing protein n=1 Tax=Thalassomonas sp. M1454 TaxID=2594477 RepID=UPI00118158FB|nr:response regulator transcription factor [Thalassomonas sp. M1454]TRX55709.1 helix-turn-helix domain-containing protein [Thalassomonas sp. M1454]